MRRLLGVAMLCIAGCSDASVGGRIGEVYPLSFDFVRARLYSSSISIEYVRNDGSVPIRVTVDRSVVEDSSRADLFASGDVTGRTNSGREIPRFNEGDIRFDALNQVDGGRIEGSWSASFQVSETDTLAADGQFSTRLEFVPDPGPPPPGR